METESGDGEVFFTPPRFSTLRVNTLVAEIDSVEEDLKAYLRVHHPDCSVSRHPRLPEVLVVRSADRLPLVPSRRWLVVDALCGVAVLRGADVYAPGVLACPADLSAGELVSVYADLDARCLRGRTQAYGGKQRLAGNGIMQLSRHELFTTAHPSGVAVRITEPVYGLPSLGPFCGRRAFLQNLPSVLVSRVLAPLPGELVLDMCAAPGGKTTHLAHLMANQGLIVAVDKTMAKVACMSALLKEQAVSCVLAICDDSTHLIAADSACQLRQRHVSGGPCACHGGAICEPPFAPATFDRVLVDAPCSGLGQRPRLVAPPARLDSYPHVQRRLLLAAADALRPGGTLVYSTCTTPAAENERQVAALLLARPWLRLVPSEPRLGQPGLPDEGLDDQQRALVQRFWPDPTADSCDGDTVGFFLAKMVKCHDG